MLPCVEPTVPFAFAKDKSSEIELKLLWFE